MNATDQNEIESAALIRAAADMLIKQADSRPVRCSDEAEAFLAARFKMATPEPKPREQSSPHA